MSHVLLAEDDDGLNSFMKRALESQGHIVENFFIGSEAVQRLQESGDVHFVVTDLKMPGANGLDVIKAAIASNVVKILLCSSDDEPQNLPPQVTFLQKDSDFANNFGTLAKELFKISE